jgi:glycosyltransferase involved in cell wall biosynthesis
VALDGVTDMRTRVPNDIRLEVAPIDFNPHGGPSNAVLYRRILRRLRPDRLVTYNWGSIDWALANRFCPLVSHIHIEDGFGPEEKSRQLPRRVWFRRLALTGRHTTIVLPSRTLERLARNVWRLPSGRIRYVPNGVDCDRFQNARAEAKPHPGLVVGTVATLRREKNLERLIRAFAALPETLDVRLEIVGDGAERPALEAAARVSGRADHIHFVGSTRTPEKALAQMDLFVLSSDTEQMPLSILEAMAAGLPIASVAVGDVLDMVSEENRPFVTPLGDEGALVASMAKLLGDTELRAKVGKANALAARERFDQKQMIATYQSLFG